MKRAKFHRIFLLVLVVFLLAGFKIILPQASRERPKLLSSGITTTVNPYGLAPLTAVVDFKTKSKCSVQVKVLGDIDVVKDFKDESTVHSIPILGLYPDRVNTVVLTLYTHQGTLETRTLSIKTDPVPSFFPDISVDAASPGLIEPGMNLCTLSVAIGNDRPTYPMIFDQNGVVRWYLDLSKYNGACLPFERIKNGNFIFAIGDSVYEYSLLGKLERQITVPGYNFHHDVIELPSGNFLAAVDKEGTWIVNSNGLIPSRGDHMIEIDRGTGAVVTEWDLRKVLDVARNEQMNSNGDWFHMNSFWYSPNDDCFIVSGRHQGMLKVTRDNQLKWILAGHLGWGNSGYDGSGFELSPFLLTAVDSSGIPYDSAIQDGYVAGDDFDWAWGPHYPVLLPDGNIFIFDNGARRNFHPGRPLYSRGVEYRVHEDKMTVEQVWQYGLERGEETFSLIISNVEYLPLTRNRLIVPGIVENPPDYYAKIIEVAYPDKMVVFEAMVHFKNLLAGEQSESPYDTIYRAHRISIYP